MPCPTSSPFGKFYHYICLCFLDYITPEKGIRTCDWFWNTAQNKADCASFGNPLTATEPAAQMPACVGLRHSSCYHHGTQARLSGGCVKQPASQSCYRCFQTWSSLAFPPGSRQTYLLRMVPRMETNKEMLNYKFPPSIRNYQCWEFHCFSTGKP